MSDKKRAPRRTVLLLFIVALLPRLPGLALFLTSDEKTNIFIAGSDVIAAFLRGDLRGTYWHFYPGVTMSWLDALGMGGQYLLDWLRGPPPPPFGEYIYGDILSLLVANRLPYAILTAAAGPGLYLLARRLLPDRIALLGALLMAFEPFFLAHSRVAHGDAPLAVFMSLSALAFFVHLQEKDCPAWRSPALIISAILGGLAGLSKAPGPFMALFISGLALGCAGLELRRQGRQSVGRIMRRWLAVIGVWGLVSLAVFVALWPSMWVDPVGTFRQMWLETFGKVNEGHLVYFMGRPTLDPGPWFYPYVIPFRLTPVTLAGGLLSVGLFLPAGFKRKRSLFWLWLFVISLLLFGNLSPKKQDRYLLPLFPILALLAATGWTGLVELAFGPRRNLSTLLLSGLILLHGLPLITYYPYYLAYFNPLLGGPTRAAQTTLMGWGEGMEQAAAYLNRKPEAARLYVAAAPSQTLLPYFAGTGENFYTNDIALRADYVILYLAQRQRLAPSPEIVRYFEARPPEKIIYIQGVPYAKIYPGPKYIITEMPAGAEPVNTGLGGIMRLAGYELAAEQLTLYWHALAPLEADYTISVRAYAAGGELLSQADGWPVEGLLPTSQWRQGDYVADPHPVPAEAARFEIVVYRRESGQTLGPPITVHR